MSSEELAGLNERFEAGSTEDVLGWLWERMGTQAAFGTSFQGAGLVAIDIAYRNGWRFPVFTLDTGYLFAETLELKKRIEQRHGIVIEALLPEQAVDAQFAQYGSNLYETKPDLCCYLRKVEPLKRKLATLDGWITGLRRNQVDTRTSTGILELYEFDPVFNKEILKINPMAKWSKEAVWDFLRREAIPYNPLHDRGYKSIGCWPCTKPVGEGDNERAGRWTGFDKTECGIHTFMEKKK
ncbi:phosphoadenylyl-sulfate reductase [Oscillatoria laete-virens NRMC-F 0139]|nr:phosphoadenylyl-sulfate reductase [Oscillatoria laete-virens NRMC-F 0139]